MLVTLLLKEENLYSPGNSRVAMVHRNGQMPSPHFHGEILDHISFHNGKEKRSLAE